MTHFVLAYHRSTGLLATESFETIEDALRRRFELELERTDPDLELVTLSGPSIDALKSTHARYFQPVGQLMRGAPAERQRRRHPELSIAR